jgi:hypothetical protein
LSKEYEVCKLKLKILTAFEILLLKAKELFNFARAILLLILKKYEILSLLPDIFELIVE